MTGGGAGGQDDRRCEQYRAGGPGRPEPVVQHHRGQAGAGERLDHHDDGGRTGGHCAQAAEVERVRHGRRPDGQRDEEGDRGRAGVEAQPAGGHRRDRGQPETARREREAGRGQGVETGYRNAAHERDRGEAGRGQQGQPDPGPQRPAGRPAPGQADEQGQTSACRR
jgi:hypothetical protein